MLLGLACVFITAIALASVGIWQGRIFSYKASTEAHKLVDADLNHIMESVYNLIKYQDDSIREKVNNHLKMARYILQQSGRVYLSSRTVSWKTVNQNTAQVSDINIPQMMVGGLALDKKNQISTNASVVDLIKQLVGESCTIFQRINPGGDMLRIATADDMQIGNRAVGTYISAVNPDGKPNPISRRRCAAKNT
jgi:ElaB/YqjD/DUF883 family membrane-anchored ribosome-binding protein